MSTTYFLSSRIQNATGMSEGNKAFLQLIYGTVLLYLNQLNPSGKTLSPFTLRLTNCNGCGKSPNSQYSLQGPQLSNILRITGITDISAFIQSVLSKVVESQSVDVSPIQQFFANFQTLQNLDLTILNNITQVNFSQLQNVIKIATNGIYDIRNYDCTKNGDLQINATAVMRTFADQITAVISMSCSQCIATAKFFPFFAYDQVNKIILNPVGRSLTNLTQEGSYCVINTTNNIIDSITLEIVGQCSYASVCAIDANGSPLQSIVAYYSSNHIFHTYSVNPNQGYALFLGQGNYNVYVTGVCVSYLPYTPPVNSPVKNTYIPPLPNFPFLIRWKKNPSQYITSNSAIGPRINGTTFTYDNIKNLISPPLADDPNGWSCFGSANNCGVSLSVKILSHGNSALLALTGYPNTPDGMYAYTFNDTNEVIQTQPPYIITWFEVIDGDVEKCLTTQPDVYEFEYEYVIISEEQLPQDNPYINSIYISVNKLLANSSLLQFKFPNPGLFVSDDTIPGYLYSYLNTYPTDPMLYYATNVSSKVISLLSISFDGQSFEEPFSIYNSTNFSPNYNAPILSQIQNAGKYLIKVNIPPGSQYCLPLTSFFVTIKPYTFHANPNYLDTNEYMNSGSVSYMPRQGQFVSTGDALWDSTNTNFLVLQNGDLCFGSKSLGIIYTSNTFTNGQGKYVIFSNYGQLMVVDVNGNSLWKSNNIPNLTARFGIQENGDYPIFNGTTPVWSQMGMVPHSNSLPPVLNPTPPVPAGTLPIQGKQFVIASAASGLFLNDNGVMTNDIKAAKVFTYNTLQKSTNESINNINITSPMSGTPSSNTLMINFSGINALVGPSYYSNANGVVLIGIFFSGNTWGFGSIDYNVAAALGSQYYNSYAAVLYYV